MCNRFLRMLASVGMTAAFVLALAVGSAGAATASPSGNALPSAVSAPAAAPAPIQQGACRWYNGWHYGFSTWVWHPQQWVWRGSQRVWIRGFWHHHWIPGYNGWGCS